VLLNECRPGCTDISNSLHHEFILGIDDDSFVMHFVNKVMGPNHKGSFPDIVNKINYCIQHSALGENAFFIFHLPTIQQFSQNFNGFSLGPDIFFPAKESVVRTTPIQIRPSHKTSRVDFREYYCTMLGSHDKFVENKYKAGKKKPLSGCSRFVSSFAKSGYFVPDYSKLCCYAIITDQDDHFANLSFLSQRDNDLEGTFVVPKLQDSIDGVKFRHFHVIPSAQYILFKNKHKQGITTMNGVHNHVAYFDSQVKPYSLFCHFTTTY